MDEIRRKRVNRLAVLWVKYMPVFAVMCSLTNTIGSYVGKNFEGIGYLVMLALFVGLLLLSHALRFCGWHRCLIWYMIACEALNTYDYYIGIPVGVKGTFMINLILIGVTAVAITYFHVKENERGRTAGRAGRSDVSIEDR